MATSQIMSQRQLEIFADEIKAITVGALVESGLVAHDIAEDWSQEHTLICRKKSIFRTFTAKWKNEEPLNDGAWWMVVKSIHHDA